LIRERYPDGLPWTTQCFFCDETITHSSSINHFQNDCQNLNWIQDRDISTDDILSRCIYDDGDITVKLNSLDTACFILSNTVVMLKRKAGNEWKVAVVGSDPIQLKYSEEMTKNSIKYVLLNIQPRDTFKEFDVFSLLILKGVLRIVLVVDDEDKERLFDAFRSLELNCRRINSCATTEKKYEKKVIFLYIILNGCIQIS
jgi:hypothetical protein